MALQEGLTPAGSGTSGECEGNQGGNESSDLKSGLFHGVLPDGVEAGFVFGFQLAGAYPYDPLPSIGKRLKSLDFNSIKTATETQTREFAPAMGRLS
ncbi:hypothetical protein [Meiothermus granaticius]|uniref:hypothetical protein n=1 Tax=Meiothermus granaticius TaxID=863370 RepID=UPI0011BE2694|nr:hypothetical protein [Meiothermus granaticius]